MKNKKLIGLSLTLMGLILMYVGTYAFYMKVINGTINGRVGAFTFDVLHNNSTFTSINLYDTITGTPKSNGNVIVPGDSGQFTLTAKGTGSSTDIEYSITFNGSSVPTNMKFYLDENKTRVLDVQTNRIDGFLDKTGSMVKDHTIYWEWPYDSGEYNDLDYEFQGKDISIDVNIEGKQSDGMLVYGVSRDTNSTSTSWTRVENSVGLEANAVMPDSGTTTVASQGPTVNLNVKNDFDNIYPWSEIRSYNYDASLKKVTAWYGDSNFTFDGSNGEVLTYIPGFWYKREVINGTEYQYISKFEQEGYSYSEPFSVGRYKISGGIDADNSSQLPTSNDYDSKVELMMAGGGYVFKAQSKSGVYPSANATIGEFRESASTLGNEFSLMDYHWFVIQMLYLVEYADYDVQSVLGLGNTQNDSISAIRMGGTDDLGMKSGCIYNDGKHSSIYRGMEDLYSNVFQFLDGINIKDYQAYINYDFTTYWSDTFDGNYKPLGYVNSSGDNWFWITKTGYDSNNPLIGLPTGVDTTNTDIDSPSGIKDAYATLDGNKILAVGGMSQDSYASGLWCFKVNYYYFNLDGFTGSRLIRHQTSTGREVMEAQQ